MQASSEAYNALLKAIPGAAVGENVGINQDAFSMPPPLCQKDYPKIKFWFKRQWTEFTNNQPANALSSRGRSRASQGINVAMQYVELEDGTVIDGDRATEMRKFARGVWVSFAKNGAPPSKWGQADVQARQQYINSLSSRFPELRLCDLDWKAEQIATDNYPSWYNTWLSKQKARTVVKEEEAVDAPPQTQVTKRSRKASSVKSEAKRVKLAVPRNGGPENTAGDANHVAIDIVQGDHDAYSLNHVTAISQVSFQ
jgi:hypothetical protein